MWLRLLFASAFIAMLCYVVLQAVKFEDLQQEVARFDKTQLFLLFAISYGISFIRSWRFWLLLRSVDVKIPFWQLFKIYIAGQATSPLPGGEASRGVLLKKEANVDIHDSSGPIFTQAIIETIAAVVIVLIGSFYYKMYIVPALITLTFFSILIGALVNKHFFNFILKQVTKINFFEKHESKIVKTHKGIKKIFIKHNSWYPRNIFLTVFCIALVVNIIGGLLLWIISRSYHVPVDIAKSLYIFSASIVLQTISIIPGGIGFTEGGMTGIFLLFKVPLSTALAVILIFRLVTLLFNVVVGLVFLSLFYAGTLLFSKKI